MALISRISRQMVILLRYTSKEALGILAVDLSSPTHTLVPRLQYKQQGCALCERAIPYSHPVHQLHVSLCSGLQNPLEVPITLDT